MSSCDSSGKNGGEDEVPQHPMVGTYRLDTYKTEGEKNLPVSSPLYTVWSGNEATENMANIFRMMGGAMIPQDMQIIVILFESFGKEWKNTTDFRLGLSLVKNN